VSGEGVVVLDLAPDEQLAAENAGLRTENAALRAVNHPGVSGDSICWESWGHGKIIEELSA
jgi:hypothetical protein